MCFDSGFSIILYMKKARREFFGRESEFAQLSGLWKKRVASLVTCRGRRRIGKSTLIEEFAIRSGARFIKLEGLRPKSGMTERDQLAFFAAKLSAQTGCESTPPADWYSAFVRLDRELRDLRLSTKKLSSNLFHAWNYTKLSIRTQ